jgi:hypothetical protein
VGVYGCVCESEDAQGFRNALESQLTGLLGAKPRFEAPTTAEEPRWAVFEN